MGYGYLNSKSKAVYKGFPKLSAKELSAVNDMFKHYIFYESTRDGRTLWTSCCGKKGVFYPSQKRTQDINHYNIAHGIHNDTVKCPYCGQEATLKSIGRLGKKRSIEEYIPVLFLHEKNGDIYAQGYWARKTYDDLAQEPHYKVTYVYHFTPGKATSFYRGYSEEWEHIIEPEKGSRQKITEPFKSGTGYFSKYEPYRVIGIDAIEKSAFKYCQYMTWANQSDLHCNLIKYLTAACQYPYALEMLIKNGFRSMVDDLIYAGRKNRDVFNWKAEDPREAFGITGTEFKQFMLSTRSIGVLRIYKLLKKHGFKASFEIANTYKRDIGYKADEFIKYCRKYGVKPTKLYRYLSRETGPRCYGGYYTHQNAFCTWQDYVNAADAIGYDLTVETVLLPRDMHDAHNNATAEHNRRLREQQAAEQTAREAERRKNDKEYRLRKEAEEKAAAEVIKKREAKYTYEADGFIIRPAMTSEEVIAEGKILQHCVGGYAARHMEGKLTICVMRDAKTPNIPFLTIEMDSKGRMVQIHGYKNECENGKTIAQDPEEKYRYILEPWLQWISKGSRRDKHGKPILPKNKEANIA